MQIRVFGVVYVCRCVGGESGMVGVYAWLCGWLCGWFRGGVGRGCGCVCGVCVLLWLMYLLWGIGIG